MSHITKITTQIKDLNALKSACTELGFKFVENAKTYKWYGTFVGYSPLPEGMKVEDLGKCIHKIVVPGNEYEIGIIKSTDGKYSFAFDYWNDRYVSNEKCKLENVIPRLTQMYGVHYTTMLARQKGQSVSRSVLQNGSIQLRIHGGL